MATKHISSPSSMTSTPDSAIVYKGKYTRSWQQLPSEIIRLIATFYLLDVSSAIRCPNTWQLRDMWPSRLVFVVLRQAIELETLMCLCPSWGLALENHLFWQHALTVIDPHNVLAHCAFVQSNATAASTNVTPIRVTPYHHFQTIKCTSCIVCRINVPYSNNGLAYGKRPLPTPLLGGVFTCREHRKTTYCGICLREAPTTEGEVEFAQGTSVLCVENEDEDTWPGVEATCRLCRAEWLWRRVQYIPADREAVGGSDFSSADWETRQTLEAFLDLGEGTIADVITLAREKYWLRRNTKLSDMLQQALAASRFVSRAEAGEEYGSDDELSDEEDPELMSITEDAGGIREIAINDWARNRILDGHWISPADQWYGYTDRSKFGGVPAQHPCPWNRGATYNGALEDGESEAVAEGAEFTHPRPKTLKAPVPPTFQLCEQAYKAFIRQMRETLLPAMNNIVRRLVIEGTADGVDPTMKTARMTPEDVMQELRDEWVWFNGIDWLERRANAHARDGDHRAKDDDASSSSSRSDGSHTTSPVLSTTTLQTTPSPPPTDGVKDDDRLPSPATRSTPTLPIAVSPVLKTPELLHPIPYIPVTTAHMPLYSLEAFNSVWREACAPLYQCRCSICERAILKANIAAGHIVPSQPPPEVVPAVQQVAPATEQPVAISLSPAQEKEGDDEDEDGESEKGDDTSIPESVSEASACRGRKRSSRELDADAFTEVVVERVEIADVSGRDGSPPKRARKEGSYSPVSASPSPSRLRKRSSAELEDSGEPIHVGNGDAKRLRADVV